MPGPIQATTTDKVVEWRLPTGGAFVIVDEVGNELFRVTADGDTVKVPASGLTIGNTTLTADPTELNARHAGGHPSDLAASPEDPDILAPEGGVAQVIDEIDATKLSIDGVAVTATAAEISGLDISAVFADGAGLPVRCASATWDESVDVKTQTAVPLGVTVPDNSLVLGCYVDVQTTCTTASSDTGTGALHLQGANDLVAAVAVDTGTPWDQGIQVGIPKWTAATMFKTTAEREITFTIATQNWTAGKFTVHVFYIPTEVNA